MRYVARHPFKYLSLVSVVGFLFHSAVMAEPQATHPSTGALSVHQYVQQFHDADTLKNTGLVSQFYRDQAFLPTWVSPDPSRYKIDSFLEILRNAHIEGLVLPGRYVASIEALLNSPDNKDQAWLDVLLTDAFISYVQQAGKGQLDPHSLQENWNYKSPEVDPLKLLVQALESNDIQGVLSTLSPQHAGYQRLVDSLSYYTAIKEQGGWPQFPIYGPSLSIGTESEEVTQLRERLRITGDLPVNASNHAVYGYELENAVKRFQKRHGIEADGVVGEQTRFALHAPVEKRIQQITANLERWRWLPRDMGDRHIRVNTAGFELQAIENDQAVMSMRVVVGKTKNRTPSFSEDMQYLEVNPYWDIPNRIARDELIVREQATPGYLARKNIRVISGKSLVNPNSINWSEYQDVRNLPIRLRQDPGSSNALGLIKFMMPNKHNVYLHDTPSKKFFDQTQRTFSHGCVRVEDPVKLADYVLGDEWDTDAIQQAVDSKNNRRLKLPESLPVHIIYQTVWVNESGEVNFRKDLYRNDRYIMARLPAAQSLPQRAFVTNETVQEPLSLLESISQQTPVN